MCEVKVVGMSLLIFTNLYNDVHMNKERTEQGQLTSYWTNCEISLDMDNRAICLIPKSMLVRKLD